MRSVLLLMLALSGVTPAAGRGSPVSPPDSTPPAAPAIRSTDTSLNVSASERQYFELGAVLSRAAFTYAVLARQMQQVSHARMSDAQLAQIGRLAPDARQAHDRAHTLLDRAVTLLQGLQAPPQVVTPLAGLAGRFARPLTPTGTSKQIAAFAPDAGTVLAALDESAHLSNLLDSRTLRAWATGPGANPTGKVWYAEGLLTGVAGLGLPDLLPPAGDLATDLRGLRDWLSLRLPEEPTPDQAALQAALETFLQRASAKGRRPKPLTTAQVRDLGGICRLLQAQVLPPDSPLSVPPPPALEGPAPPQTAGV